MNVSDAVSSRRSVRQFTDQPVDLALIQQILEKAQRAPSGGNTQPWNAIVMTGAPLADLTAKIKAKVMASPRGEGMEYDIYPKELEGRYAEQRFAVGEAMFAKLGIAREDKAARLGQMAHNFDSFGAPVQLFTYTRGYMGPPQWSDMGMWLQTVMLLLREAGLDSCAQEIWAQWGHYIKTLLAIDNEHVFFCGMAIGYRDPDAPINQFTVPRISINQAIEFRGFDAG